MSIARHGDRLQVCCDTCPASYPNKYLAEDFGVMITDARTAGWIIRKAAPKRPDNDTSDLFGTAPRIAGVQGEELFTHTCPSCESSHHDRGLF